MNIPTNTTNYETGKFKGDVVAKWLPDGRSMKLLTDFSCIDGKGNLLEISLNSDKLYVYNDWIVQV